MSQTSLQQLEAEVMPMLKFYKDFPKPGINFLDIFSVTENPQAFKKVIAALQEHIVENFGQPGVSFTHLAGIESKGFVIGPILAMNWDISFIPIRKKNKLPGECYKQEYTLEYGTDTIEVQKTAFPPGSKVILIDDLLATGGTLGASEKIVSQFTDVSVVANVVIFEIDFLNGRKNLQAPVLSLIHLK